MLNGIMNSATLTKQCIICGDIFERTKNRSLKDWENKKYCSKDCANKGLISREKINCKNCGNIFERKRSNKTIMYCSPECRKEKIQNHVVKDCDICGNPTKITPSLAAKIKDGVCCSRTCRSQYKKNRSRVERVCVSCGNLFLPLKTQVDAYGGKYCGNACRYEHQRPLLARNNQLLQQGITTRIEILLYSCLDNIGVSYLPQALLFDKFTVDALIPEFNLVIEADGEYWHGHPRFYPLNAQQKRTVAKDNSRNAYLSKCGYTILRFWESEFDHIEIIKQKICEHLKSQ